MVRREGLQCHTGVPIHRWRLPGAHAAPRSLPKFRRVAVTYCALGDGVRQPRQMEGLMTSATCCPGWRSTTMPRDVIRR